MPRKSCSAIERSRTGYLSLLLSETHSQIFHDATEGTSTIAGGDLGLGRSEFFVQFETPFHPSIMRQ
jgi:hypothetical protein